MHESTEILFLFLSVPAKVERYSKPPPPDNVRLRRQVDKLDKLGEAARLQLLLQLQKFQNIYFVNLRFPKQQLAK